MNTSLKDTFKKVNKKLSSAKAVGIATKASILCTNIGIIGSLIPYTFAGDAGSNFVSLVFSVLKIAGVVLICYGAFQCFLSITDPQGSHNLQTSIGIVLGGIVALSMKLVITAITGTSDFSLGIGG